MATRRLRNAGQVEGEPSASFMLLARVVAAGDRRALQRMLAATPGLVHAQAALEDQCFLESIQHQLYGGDTALHVASAAFHADTARHLLRAGAAVRAKNRRGAEPLHYAADANSWHPDEQVETIRCLLEAGADANALDKSGVMPLHRAVRTRSAPAVQALLAGGAEPRARNRQGSMPLHLALQTTGRGGSGSPEAREQQALIVRLLLAAGARRTDKDANGRTAASLIEAANGKQRKLSKEG